MSENICQSRLWFQKYYSLTEPQWICKKKELKKIPFDTKRVDAAAAGVHPHARPEAGSQATCVQYHKIAAIMNLCLSATEALQNHCFLIQEASLQPGNQQLAHNGD